MGLFQFNKSDCVYAFTSGRICKLSEVNDNAFSQGLLGNGIAIESIDGRFFSPVDGVVSMVFPTMHAIGIKSKGGFDLILHIGIDTVKLQGKGFRAFVEEGSSVKKGDLLLDADLDLIRQEGYDPVSILVVTDPINSSLQYSDVTECSAKRDLLFKVNK